MTKTPEIQACERCKNTIAMYHIWKRDTGAIRLCGDCITQDELEYLESLKGEK